MKTYHFKKIILFSILLGSSQVSWAACSQTLSPGANVASAISGAAAGTTICLNSGDYGKLTLSGVSKSSPVTLQSASGVGATIGITALSSSNNLIFKNLKLSTLMWSGNANTNIKVLNNTFTGQMYIYGNGNGSPQNNVIDGNTFDGIDACSSCREGRLQIYAGGNLIVSNNHFGRAAPTGPGGDSDGIQLGGYGTIVGPGNVFDGILIGPSGRHVDAMQLYGEVDHVTVNGNYFKNGGSYLFNFSESTVPLNNAVTITNNVFVGGNYYPAVQNSSKNLIFKHNTMIGVGVNIDGQSTTSTAQDNLFTKGGSFNVVCTSCTISHNMYGSSGDADGTNNIIGTPTFVGGTSPTTWTGYQLTSSSVSYRAALDGQDIGATYFGVTPTLTLISAPSNLRLN
jgi:hypothetical protein